MKKYMLCYLFLLLFCMTFMPANQAKGATQVLEHSFDEESFSNNMVQYFQSQDTSQITSIPDIASQLIAFFHTECRGLIPEHPKNKYYHLNVSAVFPSMKTKESMTQLVRTIQEEYASSQYVDLDAIRMSVAPAYEPNGSIYVLEYNPFIIQTILTSALPRAQIREQLKKLHITKKTPWKVATKRISKWIVKTFRYSNSYKWCLDLAEMWETKRAVCHGYASVFYAMAKECGLDVHYVCAKNSTYNHAYNYIVKNRQKYYYDITWASRKYDIKIITKIPKLYTSIEYVTRIACNNLYCKKRTSVYVEDLLQFLYS